MDRTRFPELDPKLKESYERIMGQAYPSHRMHATHHKKKDEKVYIKGGAIEDEKPRSKVKTVLIAAGVAVLLYVYALIWAAVFHYKLPFSPL